MLKHIVLFKFKDENKQENLLKAKELLEALVDSITSLKSMEVGLNFSKESRAMDLSIIAIFDTIEDLEIYSNHPKHLEVVKFIKSVVLESKVSDYIV